MLAVSLTLYFHGSFDSAADSPTYQDSILTKVRTTVVDNACSTSTQSDAATYGNTARHTLDASARCSDVRGAVYTVEVAGTEYELTPDHSRVARASARLPLSATFLHQGSLANHLAGTAVKLRRDDAGYRARRQARIALPRLRRALTSTCLTRRASTSILPL